MASPAPPPPFAPALGLLALPGTALALALMLGAGMLRQGQPLLVSIAAGAVVLLPALGLGSLLRQRALGVSLGLLLWPVLLLVGFPLYFPDERADALASGLAVMTLPLGLEPPLLLARALDEALPSPSPVRPPAPRAEPLAALPDPLPVLVSELHEGSFTLPYEGRGRSMIVPVHVEGPRAGADVSMIFDTGATLTTLDPATLAAIGVEIPSDAPEVTVRTAAGERQARLVVIDRLWLAGVEIEGVTVSVCEACADGETVGLLGLNVSGHFRTTVDHAREELVLEPRPLPWDRALDVGPWLMLEATATRWEDGRVEVEVRGRNRSLRAVERATVAVRCAESWAAELEGVAPGEQGTRTIALPVGARCEDYIIALERAAW